MKKYFVLIILLLVGSFAKAQTFCKTPAVTSTESQRSMLRSARNSNSTDSNTTYRLKLYFHVIRMTNGSGGISYSQVQSGYDMLNADFNSHRIYFNWDGIIDYIDNSSMYNDPDTSVFRMNNHSDGIDIYLYHTNANISEGLANGVGMSSEFYLSGNSDNTPLCATHVISHEMGHVLNLWHTHHGTVTEGNEDDPNYDANQCSELVDGSNSDSCGDYVQDTPADPFLGGRVNPNTGQLYYNIYDPTGQLYQPDVHLIMSYTPPSLMAYFSDLQGERMRYAIEHLSHLQRAMIRSISGSSILVDSASYCITNIDMSSSAWDVVWTADPVVSGGLISLQVDSLDHSRCNIEKYPETYFKGNIYATIYYNNDSITTISRTIYGHASMGDGFYLIENYPNKQIIDAAPLSENNVITVTKGKRYIIYSPNFGGMNMIKTDANPIWAMGSVSWFENYENILAYWEDQAFVDFRIYNYDPSEVYNFRIYFLDSSPLDPFYINRSGNIITVQLQETNNTDEVSAPFIMNNKSIADKKWKVEVFEPTFAKRILSMNVEGNSTNIDCSGWRPGLYIIRAIYKDKVYSEKIQINR